jgi:hypothetical protein
LTDDWLTDLLAGLPEYLFDNDGNTFIELTIHSGVIAALLGVIGRREFKPKVGDVFPILAKGEAVRC